MGLFDGAASGIIGGIGNIIGAGKQNRAQKKAQMREFEYNTKMWNMANEYNSPEQQMARLKDAGLNPNLVYGNGSVVGNTSTQTPKYQAPNLQRLPLEQLNPLSILSQFQDLKIKSAQADNVEEVAKSTRIKNIFLQDRLLDEATSTRIKTAALKQIYGANAVKGIGNLPGYHVTDSSPYMKGYQAEVMSKEQRNALNQVQIDFYKSVPKEYQWIAPLLMKLIK